MHRYEELNRFGLSFPHFDYEEIGPKGAGKNNKLIVNMDPYIDHSMDDDLFSECSRGLALCENDYKIGMIFGDIPPEEEERLKCKSWTRIIKDFEKYDPTGTHSKNIEELLKIKNEVKLVYRYIYFAMNGVMPWFFALYLKTNSFFKKTGGGEFTEAAKHFPLLIEYVNALPFKQVGRILLFTTYPGSGVAIHRDAHVAEHKDHNINLFFGPSRPSFIWDEVKKEKHYLDSDARSYFFNNRDYHGVDVESSFRFTVRIDGTFTDELCEKLGLVDGYTWKPEYERKN